MLEKANECRALSQWSLLRNPASSFSSAIGIDFGVGRGCSSSMGFADPFVPVPLLSVMQAIAEHQVEPK